MVSVYARIERFADRHPAARLLLDVQGRYGDLQGGIVASAVTLTLFLSLFPLALVATAVVGFVASRGNDVASSLVETFGLTGAAAQTVTDAVAAAERSRRSATLLGVVGLVWSASGVAGAMKTAIDRAWQAKGHGLRDRFTAVIWLGGAGLMIAAFLALTGVIVRGLPGWATSLAIVVTVAGYVLLFWWTFHMLGAIDVGWRPLLPGAIAAGVGFELLNILGAFIVPRAVASSSALYGSIGVVFGLIAWLFVFGRVIVYSCVLNVVLYERNRGTARVEVEVPRVDGHVPLTGTRAGAVDHVVTPPISPPLTGPITGPVTPA